jgi:hypothetical protein
VKPSLIALLCAALAQLARADSPPDRSQYTLFNPTPDGQLRDMDTDRPNITNTPHTIDVGLNRASNNIEILAGISLRH